MTTVPASPPFDALVLVAHGSRDPAWFAAAEDIARRAATRLPADCPVRNAYLELAGPSLEDVVGALAEKGCRRLRLFPLFIGMGHHVRSDLPRRVAALAARWPGLRLDVLPSAGDLAPILDALADQAVRSLPLE